MKKYLLIPTLLLSFNSFAQQSTPTTFQSTAKIEKFCSVQADDIGFGEYNVEVGNTAIGNVAVHCTKDVPYIVGLNYYMNGYDVNSTFAKASGDYSFNGEYALLKHSSTSDTLKFNIFKDASHSQIFGDSQTPEYNWSKLGAIVSFQQTGTGNIDNIPIYAATPKGQYVRSGVYSVTYGINVYY